jgi:hypothetical protein
MKFTLQWLRTCPTVGCLYEILESVISKQEESQPSVAVECLAHLILIRKVPDSSLCQVTGYPERYIAVILSSSWQMPG